MNTPLPPEPVPAEVSRIPPPPEKRICNKNELGSWRTRNKVEPAPHLENNARIREEREEETSK
jgi:hypothetical protein